jgi:putative glutamine amidotransferase
MNVTLGGTLHQHIGHFYTEDTGNIRSVLPRKSISLTPGSRLHELLQVPACRVNALHHQSIKDLGDEVLVSASESSGVVQAIERRGHPFFVGVQWHPEYMPQSRLQQRLFGELVNSAGINRQRVAY